MLLGLAIRDVVLIERLELGFGPGLTVLTGETGGGKTILLESLGLALGARAQSGLVRSGAEQASVAAVFGPPLDGAVDELLAEHGVTAADGEIVLRRVVGRDGRSRAFINDQPVGVALLQRLGALLVEVQGQGEQAGLADPASHAALLDAYGVPAALRGRVAETYRSWREAESGLAAARVAFAEAERDRDWLDHAVAELGKLAPSADEEELLAAERQRLQRVERRAGAIEAALAEIAPAGGRGDRRGAGPGAALRAASRALQRLAPAGGAEDPEAAPALAALGRAEEALAEAETLLQRVQADAVADPRALERAEERLFALRASARKHDVAVIELPELLDRLQQRLATVESGEADIAIRVAAVATARAAYEEAAGALTQARQSTASRLERAVAGELRPLKLERARFFVALTPLPESGWSGGGADQVRFLLAANPGQEPGPLGRVASGGELSRLMLALKVVLSSASPVSTLIFDEVDSGIGGATAASVGERLARVAAGVQVLVVTHSPQVAARGGAHLRVAKRTAPGRAETVVDVLDAGARREEIARMLAGSQVTEAARAAAADLLGAA
ncbi:MAG: DNA repair protein RecN [Acetobacteraceae bacterium]|nr:DNA repair protein RecN [Acetobacteraceae bacterium]